MTVSPVRPHDARKSILELALERPNVRSSVDRRINLGGLPSGRNRRSGYAVAASFGVFGDDRLR